MPSSAKILCAFAGEGPFFELNCGITHIFTFPTQANSDTLKNSATAGVSDALTPSTPFGRTQTLRRAVRSVPEMKYSVAVVGGGPSGACAAEIFAKVASPALSGARA